MSHVGVASRPFSILLTFLKSENGALDIEVRPASPPAYEHFNEFVDLDVSPYCLNFWCCWYRFGRKREGII